MDPKFPMIGQSPGPAPSMDALRERAAGVLERALGFVERHGDETSRLRAYVALEATSSDEGLNVLEGRQDEDGSFSPLGCVLDRSTESRLREANVPDEILGSLEALAVLADWRLLYAPAAERVVDFLRSAQQPDGGWGVASGSAADSNERIYTAAMLAGFCGSTRSARPEMIVLARDYIARHWSVERIRKEGWMLVTAYAHYYSIVTDDDRDVALPWCGRELERGYSAGEYSARASMRVLLYCDAVALPGTEFDIPELLGKLLDEAQDDGSFDAGEPSATGRLGPTIDAMIGILRLCRTNI
jgi:hypothetical protein